MPSRRPGSRPLRDLPRRQSRLREDKNLISLLKSAVDGCSDQDGWAYLADVGNNILHKKPDFDPRNYGYKKLQGPRRGDETLRYPRVLNRGFPGKDDPDPVQDGKAEEGFQGVRVDADSSLIQPKISMINPLLYLYLFPLGILVASLALSAGVSSSNFWIPIYFIWLGIDPRTSFWLALLTMIFGFGSGILRHEINKNINWTIVKQYLKIAVPFAILGALLVPFAPANLLLELFGTFVIMYGAFLVYHFGLFYQRNEPRVSESREKIYWFRAAVAGFLQGLIATGTGKIIMPCLLRNCRIRTPAEAVGSTAVIIFVVTLFAAIFRLTPDFTSTLAGQGDLILNIMMWVAPGVIIGGQIGPSVAKRLSEREIRVYVGILLVFVGILIYMRTFSGY